ncbi:MAG: metallophosphoesterase [Patescibacteria group bacterium]
MKILHYSDKSSPNLLSLYERADIFVTTGDLHYLDFCGLGERTNKKPAFGVYGNHDSGRYFESIGITDLHNRVVEYRGLKWGGFQGCLRYKQADSPMFSESEACIFADNFPYVDVLLLHAGPKGMLDDPSDQPHTGSEGIRRYVLEKKPKVVFLGHQYSDAFMQADPTRLYRTYGARLIDEFS